MKLSKIMLVILAVCVVGALSVSCAAKSDSAVSQNQTTTVRRGDLTVDITSVGNLALSHKVDLAFEMPGTVEEVLVKEAESVKEGQVLAKLDTSAWEDNIAALKTKVTQAESKVKTKKSAVRAAERQVIQKKVDLAQARINLQNAEDNLDKVEEIANLKDAIESAKFDLRIALVMLPQAGTWEAYSNWLYQIDHLKAGIAQAEKELKEILSGTSTSVSSDVLLDVAKRQLQVELARWDLEDAQKAIEDEDLVADAQKELADAQKELADAQKDLGEAKKTSPEVKAPFAGFITKVSVKGGDEVKKGTVAMVIADPNKFETDILVSEMDIPRVKLGVNATVEVDSISGLSLPAKVAQISPTATIQSGVVNYKVKVEVQSLEEALQEQREAIQTTMQERQQSSGNITSANISSGVFPGRFGQAFGSSNLTQEQINQMRQQRQQAQVGQAFGSSNLTQEQISQMRQQQRQAQAGQAGVPSPTTLTSQIAELREGLTVTVSIVVDQRTNVLLVPNRAISRSGMQIVVKVLKDGVTEARSITTGLSSGTYTEVISGLSEGEQVIIPQATTTTTTTPPRGPQTQFFMPGMGPGR